MTNQANDRRGETGPPGVDWALPAVVIIEPRALLRDCLVNCFRSELGAVVMAYAAVDEWLSAGGGNSECAVVLSIGGQSRNAESIRVEMAKLTRLSSAITLVLLADTEEPDQIVSALKGGARGYIPTSSSLAIAIEAVRLVKAGGVYVPASSLVEANRQHEKSGPDGGKRSAYFTARQKAVLDELRKGKANKSIANDLQLRESTVKVHIRNIMRKLGASNRTEAVYRIDNMAKEDRGEIPAAKPGPKAVI